MRNFFHAAQSKFESIKVSSFSINLSSDKLTNLAREHLPPNDMKFFQEKSPYIIYNYQRFVVNINQVPYVQKSPLGKVKNYLIDRYWAA
ncbi:hypothetical protein CR194_13095 [Salipaludibacillus keqinensis]|uniref:Uncharacterized protein n=1 Tax=Salipaludibacillus keqinensis TaxID=2045207 RepID=A0A323TBM6_9BACI|nr:hypothetical protein CR194_13095 [Salipaludibacillus keqinensis]